MLAGYSLRRLAGEVDFRPPGLGAHREARPLGAQTYAHTITLTIDALKMVAQMLFMAL